MLHVAKQDRANFLNALQRPDYHAEGLKILGQQSSDHSGADVVWEHPDTWAKLFIGNMGFAENKQMLLQKGTTAIVNCQEEDSVNFHEDDSRFAYMRFPIERWQGAPENTRTCDGLLAYFRPLFTWIDSRLGSGENVLVHCLAGAHRAGTAGTAYVMYKMGTSVATTLDAVRARRPCVDPIYDFADLLRRLEAAIGDKPNGVDVPLGTPLGGDSGLEGTWVYNRGQSRYKIYFSQETEGCREQQDGATSLKDSANDTSTCGPQSRWKLCYSQPLANGTVLHGVLEPAEMRVEDCEGHWDWAATVSNGAKIRFRRDGPLLLTSYRPAAKLEWNPPRYAERLNS